jgi:hypothetical protein
MNRRVPAPKPKQLRHASPKHPGSPADVVKWSRVCGCWPWGPRRRPATSFLGLPSLQVETLLLGDDGVMTRAASEAADVPCPVCGEPAERVHSRYPRTLADPGDRLLPQQIEREVLEHGQVFHRRSRTDPTLIFAEHQVGGPMQTILDRRWLRTVAGIRADAPSILLKQVRRSVFPVSTLRRSPSTRAKMRSPTQAPVGSPIVRHRRRSIRRCPFSIGSWSPTRHPPASVPGRRQRPSHASG